MNHDAVSTLPVVSGYLFGAAGDGPEVGRYLTGFAADDGGLLLLIGRTANDGDPAIVPLTPDAAVAFLAAMTAG